MIRKIAPPFFISVPPACVSILALALAVCAAGCSRPQPVVAGPPPPPPPAVFSAIARQGYNEGVNSAVTDIEHHKHRDVRRHLAFRRPPVAPPAWNDYRKGFRAGYSAAYRGGPVAGPPGADD